MGSLVDYITSLHTSTKRSYIDRMNDNKIIGMETEGMDMGDTNLLKEDGNQ